MTKKRISMEDFIKNNMSKESQKRIDSKTEALISDFDSVKRIADTINDLDELSDFVLDVIDEYGGTDMAKIDLSVILRVIDKIRGYHVD